VYSSISVTSIYREHPSDWVRVRVVCHLEKSRFEGCFCVCADSMFVIVCAIKYLAASVAVNLMSEVGIAVHS